jgi:UDP-2,3-diacylglucosamine hydrolase
MYSALHPSIGLGIGHRWSLNSRLGKGTTLAFLGEDGEDLIRYARTILSNDNIDYFIFGHRHLPMTHKLKEGAEIVFLGDWLKSGNFAEWDGNNLTFNKLD